MAHAYSINVDLTAGVYTATVLRAPTTNAATPTAPGNTTGPLGSSGSAAATYINGAGSAVGFTNLGDALQKAVQYAQDDLSLNGT